MVEKPKGHEILEMPGFLLSLEYFYATKGLGMKTKNRENAKTKFGLGFGKLATKQINHFHFVHQKKQAKQIKSNKKRKKPDLLLEIVISA